MLKTQYPYSEEFKKLIVSEYLSGKSSILVGLENGVSWQTVTGAVRRAGQRVRTAGESKTKYSFNHNFFENINSPQKAYFLGLILADGHVGKREVVLSLNYKDHYIIEKFVEAIEGNNTVHVRPTPSGFNKNTINRVSRLAIRSDKMIADLNALGLTNNKTYEISIPTIDFYLERHFWRGVMDGDGHVSIINSNNKITLVSGEIKIRLHTSIEVGICGHINTMTAFSDFLTRSGIKAGKICIDKSIFRVRTGGRENTLKFLSLIYSDCPEGLHLTRKFDKYQEYLTHLEVKRAKKATQ